MPHFSHARLRGSRSSSRSPSHSRQGSAQSSDREEALHRHPPSVAGVDISQFPPFPPQTSMEDDLSHIHLVHSKNTDASGSSSGSEFSLSSRSSSSSSLAEDAKSVAKTKLKKTTAKVMPRKAKLGTVGPHSLNIHTAQQRRTYFHKAKHRKEVTFGPHVCSPSLPLMMKTTAIADA
jgi:hypothetical protein